MTGNSGAKSVWIVALTALRTYFNYRPCNRSDPVCPTHENDRRPDRFHLSRTRPFWRAQSETGPEFQQSLHFGDCGKHDQTLV